MQDTWGGVLGVTKGLYTEFGAERVLDTPIAESGYIGAAIGAAATGLRPVAELMFVGFMGVCLDQLFNQAAKLRYMFGGKARVPVTIRTMIGAGLRAAAQHSTVDYSVLTHFPGLKCVAPSSAYDAKGLLIAAIRDDDPVIFCEHKALYGEKSPVPEESYVVPLGTADIKREGRDVTLVAFAKMVHTALAAADELSKSGIQAEVVDPRSLSPLDEGNHSRIGQEDPPPRRGGRRHSALRHGDRHRLARLAEGFRLPGRPAADGHTTPYTRAVQSRTRRFLPAHPRAGGRRGPRHT